MGIPRQTIEKWQGIWNHVCQMSFYRKKIVEQLQISIDDYDALLRYKNIHSLEFEKLTLDYTWKQFSQIRESNGDFIDIKVVPELTFIYVPRILFETLGVYAWFKSSFPYCVICFWEDDMKHYKDDSEV
jgi:hypothetical protein